MIEDSVGGEDGESERDNLDDDYLVTGGDDEPYGGYDGEVQVTRRDSTQKKSMALLADNKRWSKAWEEEKVRMQKGLKVTIQISRKSNSEPFGMKLAREPIGVRTDFRREVVGHSQALLLGCLASRTQAGEQLHEAHGDPRRGVARSRPALVAGP